MCGNVFFTSKIFILTDLPHVTLMTKIIFVQLKSFYLYDTEPDLYIKFCFNVFALWPLRVNI